jgi:hypothetical protein
MGKIIPTKQIVAALIGYKSHELINFREQEDGGAVVISPTGQKFKFTPKQLAVMEEYLEALETEARASAADPAPNQLETEKTPAGDPATTNILDKIMETKNSRPAAERVSSQMETETPPGGASPVTKKGRGGSATVNSTVTHPKSKK